MNILCHYTSVENVDDSPVFIPRLHLTSYDCASYLYKWFGIVQIHHGDKEEWGNWGTTLDGAGTEFVYKVLDFEDDYVLVCSAELVGEDQAVLAQPEAVAWVWSRYLRPLGGNAFPPQSFPLQ